MLHYDIPKVDGLMTIPANPEHIKNRTQEKLVRRNFLRNLIRYKELPSYKIKIDEQGKLSFIAEKREERTLEEMEKIPDSILRELPEFAPYLLDPRPIRDQLKDPRPIAEQIKNPKDPSDVPVKTIKDILGRSLFAHEDITDIPDSESEVNSYAYVVVYHSETKEFKLRIAKVHHFSCLHPAIFGLEKFDGEFEMFKAEQPVLAGNVFTKLRALFAFNDGSGSYNLNLAVVEYLLDPKNEKYLLGLKYIPDQKSIEEFFLHFKTTYDEFKKVDPEEQEKFLKAIKSEYEQSVEKVCKAVKDNFPFKLFVQYERYKEICKEDPHYYFTPAVTLSKSTPIEKKIMPDLTITNTSQLTTIVESDGFDSIVFPPGVRKSPRGSVTDDDISPVGFKALREKHAQSVQSDATGETTSGIMRKLSPGDSDAALLAIKSFREAHPDMVKNYNAEAKVLDEQQRKIKAEAKSKVVLDTEDLIVSTSTVHADFSELTQKKDAPKEPERNLKATEKSPLVRARVLHPPTLALSSTEEVLATQRDVAADVVEESSESESEGNLKIQLPEDKCRNCKNIFTLFNNVDGRVAGTAAVALGLGLIGVVYGLS